MTVVEDCEDAPCPAGKWSSLAGISSVADCEADCPAGKRTVEQLIEQGVEIQPISVHGEDEIHLLLEEGKTLDDPSLPDGWTNMYRRDDVSAVAMFYLDKTESGLPRIQPVGVRTKEMTR